MSRDGDWLLASGGATENGGASQNGGATQNGGSGNASGQGEGGNADGPLTSGGATPVIAQPPSIGCVEQPSIASCSKPCELVYTRGLSCQGSLSDLQVADTGLLIGFKDWNSESEIQQTFDFDFGAGLLEKGRFGPDRRRRVLAHDYVQNVLIEQNETALGISSFPSLDLAGAGLVLAGRFESGTLNLLTKQAATPSEAGAIELLRIDRDGGLQKTLVFGSALDARFIAGLSASSALIDPAGGRLWSEGAPVSWLSVAPSARAVANGEELAFVLTEDGSVEVRNRDGVVLLSKGGGPPKACPSPFTAYNPDICETKHPSFVDVASPERVVAATVVYTKDAPWLVSVAVDSTAQCHLATYREGAGPSCFETLPCDCRYKLEESDFRSTLELTRIDQPALSYRVDLGVSQTANLRLEASAGDHVADFTVAVAREGESRVFVDYLLIRAE